METKQELSTIHDSRPRPQLSPRPPPPPERGWEEGSDWGRQRAGKGAPPVGTGLQGHSSSREGHLIQLSLLLFTRS